MEGNIYITAEIGCFDDIVGVQLIDVIQQVKKYPGATSFNVFINSPGGEVEAGFDIYNYLRSLGVPIKTIGSGMVASIATVIFMAGAERVLRPDCAFMIHLPSGGIGGTADEIAEYANEVKAVEKRLIDFYKKVCNTTEEAIRPLLKNETFLTIEQAITLGFATEAGVAVAAKAKLFINPNTNINKSNMTPEDKNWIQTLFAGVETKIKSIGAKIVGLKLTAADGATMVEFADLADDATPVKGDKATVDGKPAEGEILMPDGTTLVFAADSSGTLEEVKPKVEDPNPDAAAMAALKAENERLAGELATAKADAKLATDGLAAVKTEVTNLKAAITSKFTPDAVDPAKGKKPGEEGEKRSLLKKVEKK